MSIDVLTDLVEQVCFVLTLLYCCTQELKRKSDKGERIMKLAEMARKVETEEEKVLPFYATSLTNDEQDEVAAAVAEPPSEKLAAVSFLAT